MARILVACLLALAPAPLTAQPAPSTAAGEAEPTVRPEGAAPLGPAETTTSPSSASSEPAGNHHPTMSVGGWRIVWDDGLHYEFHQLVPFGPELRPFRAEGHPLVEGTVGFKLQVDAAAYDARPTLPDVADGIEVRRARLLTEGQLFLFRPIDYKVEFGVTNESVYLNDFYLGLRDLPMVGTLKVGQMNAPFSLDRLTSSLDTTFMERATPVDAFAPGYLAGVLIQNHFVGDRVTAAAGWFSNGTGDDAGDASDGLSRLVGRVTWLPYVDESSGAPGLLHLGLSGSYVFSLSDSIRYRSRPESHLAPYLIDTGDIDAQNAGLVGLEAAVVYGPFSVEGEAIVALVDPRSGRDLAFWGFDVSGSWFLTGESRPYDRRTGVFSPVVPHAPFSLEKWRPGAWELKLRWSYTDLDDGPIHGGRMGILSAGVNWYLDRHWRMTLEYLYTRADGPSGDGALHTFQSRLQLRF
jgi:phosphate-selective porin OprO and OprP